MVCSRYIIVNTLYKGDNNDYDEMTSMMMMMMMPKLMECQDCMNVPENV